MQWDHRPGFGKLVELSAAFGDWSREDILTEIAKCDLVCTNCHIIRTFTLASGEGSGSKRTRLYMTRPHRA